MNWQTIHIIRILLNPRITATPLRVLRELRASGKRRLPEQVQNELEGGFRKKHALAFLRQWLRGEQLSRHDGQWVLNSFLPPFPGRAFDRMFENLLSGRRLSPVSAYLAVTDACPYDCWHCSLKQRKTNHLPTEIWQKTISDLQALGASIIGFTGGEPLARPDLPDLVKAASQGGAATIVFSSGALLEPATALALKDAGLWALCVSLDHPDAAECDRLRGTAGSYDRAIAAVRLARKTGFYTMIGTVATRPIIEQRLYDRLYQLARKLGAHELRLVEPMPCGRLSSVSADTFLTRAHVAEIRQFHVATNRRGRLPKVCAFNQIESPEVFGCGAGTQHLFIDSAGEVCPCDFTPLSFGQVTQAPLAAIWDRMNDAMGNPRRHCFIQKHHSLIAQSSRTGYPLPLEQSQQVCAIAGKEPLPDYFALVTGTSKSQGDAPPSP